MLNMPPALLAAWEAKHSAKWSIQYIAKNKTIREWISSCLLTIWGVLVIGGGAIIASNMPHAWGALVLFIGLVLIIVSVFQTERIDHKQEWDRILDSFEGDVKDPSLDLISFLELGYGLHQIQKLTRGRLVQAAKDVLVAEEKFDRMRRDASVSEEGLMTFGKELLRFRSVFDRRLLWAVEFGLSDGKPGQYFVTAGRDIPVPSEERHKY